jgi:hypothetical protein
MSKGGISRLMTLYFAAIRILIVRGLPHNFIDSV